MVHEPSHPILAVDGGGTACRVALVVAGKRFEAQLGPANVTTDPDAALACIRDGIDRVAAAAETGLADLAHAAAYLGLAGVTGPELAGRVAAAMPFASVTVEDDRRAALTGALGDEDGTLAGIGTGSFLARQTRGQTRFAGGWGLVLGDEASGAWLGRGALALTLQGLDGIVAASPLTDALLAGHGGQAEAIVAFARDAGPEAFAALAPQVIAAAGTGDDNAAQLMRRGAAYIEAAARALGWTPGEAFCLTGGVGPHYLPFLAPGLAAAAVAPKGTTLDGGLALARRLALREAVE